MNPAPPPYGKAPESSMKQRSLGWRWFRIISGWILIILGVIGLFLPFLQGILFLASGLALLSTESRWAKNLMDRLKSWRSARTSRRPPGPTPPNRSDPPPNMPN
jgi:uncharacterized membrane protein HdeD (DUF308 family)